MLTWRELWVCATYSNTAGVSRGSTVTTETSTGGFAGGGVSFLPQAPSRATPRTARGTIARETGLGTDIGNLLKAAPLRPRRSRLADYMESAMRGQTPIPALWRQPLLRRWNAATASPAA